MLTTEIKMSDADIERRKEYMKNYYHKKKLVQLFN